MSDWLALAGVVFTALMSFLGNYKANSKNTALLNYRLEQLEKKVGQHNNLEGRVITLETKMEAYHS